MCVCVCVCVCVRVVVCGMCSRSFCAFCECLMSVGRNAYVRFVGVC